MIRRRQRSRLRNIMRGYRALKRSGNLDRIAAVKQELGEYSLGLTRNHFSSMVMGRGVESGEKIVRQYLLIRAGALNLNCALLLALGKKDGRVISYLPKAWRKVLSLHGFEVAHFRSALLWYIYVSVFLLYGVVKIGQIAFAGIASAKSKVTRLKRHVYFDDLGSGNLPSEINGSVSHDVISWYLQRPDRVTGLEAVYHSVADTRDIAVGGIEISPRQGPLRELQGARAVASFALWGLRASLIAILDCLRGRWWHALLLNQAAVAAKARILPKDSLAQEYLFHNSGWIYRPLWTYEAEHRGSAITFYFYSTNVDGFKGSNGYPPIVYGWKAATWSRYLVWDEYQADFVRRAVGERTDISVVGPIWFQSSAIEMPHFNKPGVAVFDVMPRRQSYYCTLGAEFEFYVPATSKKFLEHIANAVHQVNSVMLWKRKRKIGSGAHPQFRHFADWLSMRENIAVVDPDVSAFRVIESSYAVISMPFTSTALIARELGKPSIYYDPTGQLQPDDRAAHGIPIVQNARALSTWLTEQSNRFAVQATCSV